MSRPNKIWIYRITHIDNIPHILHNGLVTEDSPKANPNFVRIGDSSLINYRKNLEAPEVLGGYLRDYIPFYLGPRSPMLYQIVTGWEDIQKVPQQNVIYLISSYEAVISNGLTFFYSDAHVRSETSIKFLNEEGFEQLDWDTIYSEYWKSDETDLRRKEKKQAEFLIKTHVPIDCIEYFGVYNSFAEQEIKRMLKEAGLNISIRKSPKKLYYDHL